MMKKSALPAALLILCLSLTFVLLNWSSFIASCARGADQELLILNVEQAKSFSLYSGAYSNAGFRHPGPLIQYYLAFVDQILSNDWSQHGRLTIATITYNTFWYILGFVLLIRSTNLRIFEQFLLVSWIVLCFPKEPYLAFQSYWNPWMVTAPFFVVLVSGAGVLQGSSKMWLPFVASASFASQSHISALIVCVVLALPCLAACYTRWRRGSLDPTISLSRLFGLLLVLALLWLPVLIDFLYSPNFGNIGQIFDSLNQEVPRAGFVAGVQFLLEEFFSRPFLPVFDQLSSTISFLIWLFLVLVPCVGFHKLQPYEQKLAALLFLSQSIAIISAAEISERLTGYRISCFEAVAVFLFWLSSVVILRFAQHNFRQSFLNTGTATIIGALVGLMLFMQAPEKVEPCSCRRMELAEQYVNQLPIEKGQLLQVEFSSDKKVIRSLAPVLTELKNRSIQFCVPDEWGFRFTPQLTCSYQENLVDPSKLVTVSFDQVFPLNSCQR